MKRTIQGPDGETTIVDAVEFVCRCGGKATVGFEGTPEGRPCVFHTMPACPKFVDLEPTEYLEWNRMGDA